MNRFIQFDCVRARIDFAPNIKKGDIGTVDSISQDGELYLVDFDHGADRVIEVKEADLEPIGAIDVGVVR